MRACFKDIAIAVLTVLALGVAVQRAEAATAAAYWDFNDGPGATTLTDSVGGHDANILGSSHVWVDEGGGNFYMSFSGAGDNGIARLAGDPHWYGDFGPCCGLPANEALDTQMQAAGSVAAWYRTDAFQGSLVQHVQTDSGGGLLSLGLGAQGTSSAGNIAGVLANNTTGPLVIGDVAAPTGASFHHAVLTWNVAQSRATLYLDGAEVGQETLNFAPELSIYPSEFVLASQGPHGQFYYGGDLDGISHWGGELSAGDVSALFALGKDQIPEPASLGLLGLGGLLLLRRRS